MTAKIDPFALAPDVMKLWLRASQAAAAGLDPALAELVKIRSSQINGCANCLHMHTSEARAAGETEARLYVLSAWRDAPFYTRARARRAGLDRGADAPQRRPAARVPRARRCGRSSTRRSRSS